ncbi:hypothetical protein L218DRAFT_945782 [Marasmius fiardii PR-910]|nr:hypothetical protein L218DRAFT_945782 [Marasmius fiardii PR-910]
MPGPEPVVLNTLYVHTKKKVIMLQLTREFLLTTHEGGRGTKFNIDGPELVIVPKGPPFSMTYDGGERFTRPFAARKRKRTVRVLNFLIPSGCVMGPSTTGWKVLLAYLAIIGAISSEVDTGRLAQLSWICPIHSLMCKTALEGDCDQDLKANALVIVVREAC